MASAGSQNGRLARLGKPPSEGKAIGMLAPAHAPNRVAAALAPDAHRGSGAAGVLALALLIPTPTLTPNSGASREGGSANGRVNGIFGCCCCCCCC